MGQQRLSSSEREIMRYIWKCEEAVSAGEIVKVFGGSKGWKIQTVSTFLTRLTEKGVLNCQKCGGLNRYVARLSEEEYAGSNASCFLEQEYGGSVKNFLTALYSTDRISKAEIGELREWLKKEEQGG